MDKEKRQNEMTFMQWLQLSFIIMKVANVIKWSWWLVFIPAYIELAAIIVVAAIGLGQLLKMRHKRKRAAKDDIRNAKGNS